MKKYLYKKTLIIRHQHNIGGQIADRVFWEGRIEGTEEVYDWDTKKHLIELAERENMNWKVLRYHRNGTISVIQENK